MSTLSPGCAGCVVLLYLRISILVFIDGTNAKLTWCQPPTDGFSTGVVCGVHEVLLSPNKPPALRNNGEVNDEYPSILSPSGFNT